MGMDANLLAIGRFDDDLLGYGQLDYPDDYYYDVTKAAVILVTLFNCVTSESSRELANCFDVDPWDFNTHYIPHQAMRWKLDDKLDSLTKMDIFEQEEIQFFKLLIDKDFYFIYQPNG